MTPSGDGNTQGLEAAILSVAQAIATKSTDGWHPVTVYGTNWGSFTDPAYELDISYRKDANNNVFLKGICRTTAAVAGGSVVTILPVGYRPAKQRVLRAIANDVIIRIDVKPTGEVVYNTSVAGTPTALGLYLCLDGILFDASA